MREWNESGIEVVTQVERPRLLSSVTKIPFLSMCNICPVSCHLFAVLLIIGYVSLPCFESRILMKFMYRAIATHFTSSFTVSEQS